MSEALHHQEIDTPDKLAPVIPLPLGKEARETIDFSEVEPEYAAEFLLSILCHPGRAQHKGGELVADVDKLIPVKMDRTPDTSTLEGRLVEIVREQKLSDMDLYDHKMDHDEIFQALAGKLLEARDRRELRPQFETTRNLAQLRSSIGDKTAKDMQWRDVIDRLFS